MSSEPTAVEPGRSGGTVVLRFAEPPPGVHEATFAVSERDAALLAVALRLELERRAGRPMRTDELLEHYGAAPARR